MRIKLTVIGLNVHWVITPFKDKNYKILVSYGVVKNI